MKNIFKKITLFQISDLQGYQESFFHVGFLLFPQRVCAAAESHLQYELRQWVLQCLVQVKLHAEPRTHRCGHPRLAELSRLPLPGQDDQLLHSHHAGNT